MPLIGAVRHVVARSLADWPTVSAAWVLLVSAITLLTTATLYAESVAAGAVQSAILRTPVTSRAVLVSARAVVPDDVAGLHGTVSEELESVLATTGGDVAFVARSTWLSPADGTSSDEPGPTGLQGYDGIEAHATLAAGSWPETGATPIQATMRDDVARSLGVSVGDQLTLADRRFGAPTVDVEIVGLWLPASDDPYWVGPGGDETAADAPTRLAPVVPVPDLLTRTPSAEFDLDWRALPDIGRLGVDELAPLRAELEGLSARLAAALPDRTRPAVRTGLPDTLEAAERSIVVTGSGFTVLMAQFALLGGYAVTLVAGILLERRRGQLALLRARGGESRHLAGLAFGEALLLAVPAVAAAVSLPSVIVAGMASLGVTEGRLVVPAGGSPDVLIVALLGGAGAVLGFMLPTFAIRGEVADARAASARPTRGTLLQRVGLDIALLALAVLGLSQLRLYGAPLIRNARGVLGSDPLLVITPAVALLAGSILALRVLPRIGEVAERALGRRRSLVAPLWARQLARRPLRYTRSALLLMLAIALGTFAVAYGATWRRSQVDQAAYQAAADVRVVASDRSLPAWAAGQAYRDLDGVEVATPAIFQPLRVGRAVSDGTLLALDPVPAAQAVQLPPATAGTVRPMLAGLADGRSPTSARPLQDGASAIEVTIEAALEARLSQPTEQPQRWGALTLQAALLDGDGRLHRIEAPGSVDNDASDGLLTIPLAASLDSSEVRATPPLSLLALEFRVSGPPAAESTSGTFEIRSVDLVGPDGGRTEMPLEPVAGWSWSSVSSLGVLPLTPAGAPLRVAVGADPSGPTVGPAGQVMYRFVAGELEPGPLRAIASPAFVAATGTGPSERVRVTAAGQPLDLEIVGTTDLFPPLDPAAAFVIVDDASLALSWFAQTGFVIPAVEWWLTTEDARSSAVARELSERYGAREVIDRAELARTLAGDPVALALIGALGLGSLAALLFAAVGFIVSLVVSISERIEEIAVLRALGASRRDVTAWLAVDTGVLLAFGLASGAVLGLLLSWLVLPFAALTQTGAAPVPPPVVVLPAELLPIGIVVVLVLLGATIAVVRAQLRGLAIADVLRRSET